jgi:3-oxoacyl-[acyl-carrier protein] reductase
MPEVTVLIGEETGRVAEEAGRVAVVTGSGRGIGRAIALELARLGFNLVVHYHKGEKEAKEVQDSIHSLGREAILVQGDISSYKDAKAIAETVIGNWPEVHAVINNAGITRDVPLVMMSESEWGEVINTNLTGVFNITRAFIYQMIRQRKGTVVNISSVAGLSGVAGQTNYCAAKAGIIGFSRALAKEVARYGITVNCVAPGYVDTEMLGQMTPEKRKAACERIPLGRYGTATEVAALVGFLTSCRARYITGQIYGIDGGLVS